LKKFFYLVSLLFAITTAPCYALLFDVGLNVGVFKPSYNGVEDKKNLYVPSIDFFVPVATFEDSNIDAGIGVSYLSFNFEKKYLASQGLNENNNEFDGKTNLNSFPAYLQLKYSYQASEVLQLFAFGKAGIAQGFKRYYSTTYKDNEGENIYLDAHISSNYFLGAGLGASFKKIGIAFEYQQISLKNTVNYSGAIGDKITKNENAKFIGIKLFYLLSYAY
jgi:hypothetical protein